jgi:hypothetical protein
MIMKNNKRSLLKLNKVTVADLSRAELDAIDAGAARQTACWENLWTLYECDVMYTGEPQIQKQLAVTPK